MTPDLDKYLENLVEATDGFWEVFNAEDIALRDRRDGLSNYMIAIRTICAVLREKREAEKMANSSSTKSGAGNRGVGESADISSAPQAKPCEDKTVFVCPFCGRDILGNIGCPKCEATKLSGARKDGE